jgi:diaminopimelate decarboxylase
MEAVYLHGNNKSTQELREALDADVGHVVIDNFREAALLNDIALETKQQQPVLLRLSPNIDPHTHRYIATGALDSKFGAAIATGQAEEAVLSLMASPGLRPVGLHAHIGSQILETEPFGQAVRTIVEFGARMRERHGFDMQQVSAGGGYAVQYLRGTPAPSRADYAEAVVSALTESCRAHAVPLPQLVVEPGRSVVARAGVALYSVGSRKEIPGVRTYLAVDGGMADNIRPALYGAAYDALVANRPGDIGPHESVTIAGKYCESGDILVRDADLPKLWAGDVLAIPVSGAYCLPLASNYNASLRPAVVFVNDGQARLVRRRETYEDLRRCEVSEP